MIAGGGWAAAPQHVQRHPLPNHPRLLSRCSPTPWGGERRWLSAKHRLLPAVTAAPRAGLGDTEGAAPTPRRDPRSAGMAPCLARYWQQRWEMLLHQWQAAPLLPAGMAGGEGEGWQLKENKLEQENQGYSLLLSPS